MSGLSSLLVLDSAPRGSSPCSWVFPSPKKINISKFQFDWMQDLPENNFRVSGAFWVNINNNKLCQMQDDVTLYFPLRLHCNGIDI